MSEPNPLPPAVQARVQQEMDTLPQHVGYWSQRARDETEALVTRLVTEQDEAMKWQNSNATAAVIRDEELRVAEAQVERLRQERDHVVAVAAQCYRLTGADPDGNEDWRLVDDACQEVQRLRNEGEAAEAASAQWREQVAELQKRELDNHHNAQLCPYCNPALTLPLPPGGSQ